MKNHLKMLGAVLFLQVAANAALATPFLDAASFFFNEYQPFPKDKKSCVFVKRLEDSVNGPVEKLTLVCPGDPKPSKQR